MDIFRRPAPPKRSPLTPPPPSGAQRHGEGENWTKLRWKRWCVEQAVAARSPHYDITADAEKLFNFIFPPTVAPAE